MFDTIAPMGPDNIFWWKKFNFDGPDSWMSWKDENENEPSRNLKQMGVGSIMVWGMLLSSGKVHVFHFIFMSVIGRINSKYWFLDQNVNLILNDLYQEKIIIFSRIMLVSTFQLNRSGGLTLTFQTLVRRLAVKVSLLEANGKRLENVEW